MKEGMFLKAEKSAFLKKKKEEKQGLDVRYQAILNSCEKKLDNAFQRIANLIKDEKKLDEVLELKRVYFREKNIDQKSAQMVEKEYQRKVAQIKEKLIDEIFNPKRKFEPSQIEPWQREKIETKEKYSQRFYSQDLAFLRDKGYLAKIKTQLTGEKFNKLAKKRREIFLKHLVLKDLIGFSPQESELDFFYKRNKQFKISEIIKEGGYLVKFLNKESKNNKFLDRGAIKLKLISFKNKKPILEIEKISENLRKKKLVPEKNFSASDKSLPLFLKLIIQRFLKDFQKSRARSSTG